MLVYNVIIIVTVLLVKVSYNGIFGGTVKQWGDLVAGWEDYDHFYRHEHDMDNKNFIVKDALFQSRSAMVEGHDELDYDDDDHTVLHLQSNIPVAAKKSSGSFIQKGAAVVTHLGHDMAAAKVVPAMIEVSDPRRTHMRKIPVRPTFKGHPVNPTPMRNKRRDPIPPLFRKYERNDVHRMKTAEAVKVAGAQLAQTYVTAEKEREVHMDNRAAAMRDAHGVLKMFMQKQGKGSVGRMMRAAYDGRAGIADVGKTTLNAIFGKQAGLVPGALLPPAALPAGQPVPHGPAGPADLYSPLDEPQKPNNPWIYKRKTEEKSKSKKHTWEWFDLSEGTNPPKDLTKLYPYEKYGGEISNPNNEFTTEMFIPQAQVVPLSELQSKYDMQTVQTMRTNPVGSVPGYNMKIPATYK